jgi:hypothetical protein
MIVHRVYKRTHLRAVRWRFYEGTVDGLCSLRTAASGWQHGAAVLELPIAKGILTVSNA